jgi:rhodanese-related sulfurtransferase
MRPAIMILCAMTVMAGPVKADIVSSVDSGSLAEPLQSRLGLYLYPQDAARALDADASIIFIDTRDPIEINFIGHPTSIDAIVPLELATHAFDPEKGTYVMEPNDRFVDQVAAIVAREGKIPTDPIFVICRSGGRSADAADLLAEAGFTNVWSIVEGFEGDKDAEGSRTLNGWRTSGLPWSYSIQPEQAWTAE